LISNGKNEKLRQLFTGVNVKILNILMFVFVAISLTACSSDREKRGSSDTFYLELKSEPGSLNPFSSSDYYAMVVQSYILEGLLTRDPDTYEWQPALAESYSESADGKKITFKIRQGAKFHDGTEVTADDVKFSFDAIMDPAYKAARLMPYYENIKEAKVLDKYTVEFTIKKKYFGN